MRSSRSALVCLLVVALATGCTSVVAGNAQPAAGLKPRPVTGETIKRVLLDNVALAKILGQSLTAKPKFPPRFGGPEILPRAFGVVSPVECAGVTTMLDNSAYQSALQSGPQSGPQSGGVRNVARETWWNTRVPARVINVAEGVVALPTAADAGALFEKFAEQWGRCDGTTVTIKSGTITFSDEISDVHVANSVLAATILIETRLSGAPPGGLRPEARALGVRGNCLVEVDVALFSTRTPSDRGSGDINTSAVDIAHAMMDKVSALS